MALAMLELRVLYFKDLAVGMGETSDQEVLSDMLTSRTRR